MIDLNDQIPAGSGWVLQYAAAINDAGWIVGWGRFGGQTQAFLLVPGGSVPGDLNCDGLVDVADVTPFVLALTDPAGYSAAFPNCDINAADLNGDGDRDGADIGAFVALLVG